MTAEILPFARDAEDAWQTYCALNDEAQASNRLIDDPVHTARRAAAHRVFTALFLRELGQSDRRTAL